MDEHLYPDTVPAGTPLLLVTVELLDHRGEPTIVPDQYHFERNAKITTENGSVTIAAPGLIPRPEGSMALPNHNDRMYSVTYPPGRWARVVTR